MTDYEIIDLLESMGSGLVDLTTLFLTIFFAYIVAVYLVGATLTKFHVLSLSAVYSSFTFFIIFLIYNRVFAMSRLGAQLNDSETVTVAFYYHIGPILMGIAWLLSVIYTMQLRSKS